MSHLASTIPSRGFSALDVIPVRIKQIVFCQLLQEEQSIMETTESLIDQRIFDKFTALNMAKLKILVDYNYQI